MPVADSTVLSADLERDLAWRVQELRFFGNQVQKIVAASERDTMRRAMVLLLYAHFEGFCKFSLDAYVSIVNAQGMKCSEASPAMVAASLDKMFRELRLAQPGSRIFVGSMPDDSKLWRFYRERQFVEQAYDFLEKTVMVSSDVIDTKSNLHAVVLRKLLYHVGLEPTLFDEYEGNIEELVNRRNGIAHGSDGGGVTEQTYSDLREKTLRVMTGMRLAIIAAARDGKYRKAS